LYTKIYVDHERLHLDCNCNYPWTRKPP